jgi:hypothetical protein
MRTLLCLALAATAIHAEALRGDASTARSQSPLLREGTHIQIDDVKINGNVPVPFTQWVTPRSFEEDLSQISLDRDLLPLASENLVREALETHNQENR